MIEVALKLKFLEFEHFSDHTVYIKNIDSYQYYKKNREYEIKCLSKYWDDVCLTHYLRKCCVFIINNLKEIIA